MAEINMEKKDRKEFKTPHNVIMENRNNINISGVIDVDSFDETNIIVITNMGDLTVKGSNLHINKLNVENGEMAVSGEIISLSYSSVSKRQGNLLSRLFK